MSRLLQRRAFLRRQFNLDNFFHALRAQLHRHADEQDRKSTRLNSSHGYISYAVFCLKQKLASSWGAIADALAGAAHLRREDPGAGNIRRLKSFRLPLLICVLAIVLVLSGYPAYILL